MTNILDYLEWRGDLAPELVPYSEVDYYIFAKLGTPDFTGIVPETFASVSIGDAAAGYAAAAAKDGRKIGLLASDSILTVLNKLPNLRRYRDLRFCGYILRIVPENTEQFSAMTILLPDGTRIVTFRGTDDTLAGWKENFLMGVEDSVPAQRDARAYLRWASGATSSPDPENSLSDNAPSTDTPILVIGHSKGGNLAVYSAATIEEDVQDRVTAVYNFDGPGFHSSFLQQPGYLKLRPRLHTVMPQHTIVGTLLTRDDNVTIVKSEKFSISAHDGFTWNVLGQQFVQADDFSRASSAMQDTMQQLVSAMSEEEKRSFIEGLFTCLSATGAVTLADINVHKLKQTVEISKSLVKDPSVNKFIVDFLNLMIKEYTERLPSLKTLPGKIFKKYIEHEYEDE